MHKPLPNASWEWVLLALLIAGLLRQPQPHGDLTQRKHSNLFAPKTRPKSIGLMTQTEKIEHLRHCIKAVCPTISIHYLPYGNPQSPRPARQTVRGMARASPSLAPPGNEFRLPLGWRASPGIDLRLTFWITRFSAKKRKGSCMMATFLSFTSYHSLSKGVAIKVPLNTANPTSPYFTSASWARRGRHPLGCIPWDVVPSHQRWRLWIPFLPYLPQEYALGKDGAMYSNLGDATLAADGDTGRRIVEEAAGRGSSWSQERIERSRGRTRVAVVTRQRAHA